MTALQSRTLQAQFYTPYYSVPGIFIKKRPRPAKLGKYKYVLEIGPLLGGLKVLDTVIVKRFLLLAQRGNHILIKNETLNK
jgi:hypothetical protein